MERDRQRIRGDVPDRTAPNSFLFFKQIYANDIVCKINFADTSEELQNLHLPPRMTPAGNCQHLPGNTYHDRNGLRPSNSSITDHGLCMAQIISGKKLYCKIPWPLAADTISMHTQLMHRTRCMGNGQRGKSPTESPVRGCQLTAPPPDLV